MTNRLDHVYFSEPLENTHSVFKKYGMRHLVNANTVFHTIFMYSKIRYTFFDLMNKKLGFFKFCSPNIMCAEPWQVISMHVVSYHD